MNSRQIKTIVLVSGILALCVGGCGNKFFDPTQVGRFRPVPAVNIILDSLGVAEETPVAWEIGEEPKPSDIVAVETDYKFRSGDTVRISIFELLQQGIPVVNDYVVTETGKISIPDVGVVQAAGLTETQLEEEIRQILEPSILRNPSVVATLMSSQQRTYSVIGDGIPAPGRYSIPRYDYRLTDALATAGGPAQFNVSYIYVARRNQEDYEVSGSADADVPDLDVAAPEDMELDVVEPDVAQPQMQAPNVAIPELQLPDRTPQQEQEQEEELMIPEILIPESEDESTPNMKDNSGVGESELELLEIISPRAQRSWPQSQVVIATSEMISEEELGGLIMPDSIPDDPPVRAEEDDDEEDLTDRWPQIEDYVKRNRRQSRPAAKPEPQKTGPGPQISIDDLDSVDTGTENKAKEGREPVKWIYKDGKWVPASTQKQQLPEPQPVEEPATEPQKQPEPAQDKSTPDDEIKPDEAKPSEGPSLDDILNPSKKSQPEERMVEPEPVAPVAEPVEKPAGNEFVEPLEDDEPVVDVEIDRLADESDAGQIEWIFKDGKWVPLQVGKDDKPERISADEVEPIVEDAVPAPEMEWDNAIDSRLLKIPADKLMAGDPRYNVVIKPGDTIYVPVDIIGECLVMGNVNRQGYINITGRPMTLKMAIAAAGGLGPLAWPKRCEVIRRIGEKKEEIVMVDLDKIASGEQPDFFIKPNDLINVGTDPTSRWRAVLRNAFRATYGFGFIYDRNFADRDFGNDPLPF